MSPMNKPPPSSVWKISLRGAMTSPGGQARHGGKVVGAAAERMPEIGRTDAPDRRAHGLAAGGAGQTMCRTQVHLRQPFVQRIARDTAERTRNDHNGLAAPCRSFSWGSVGEHARRFWWLWGHVVVVSGCYQLTKMVPMTRSGGAGDALCVVACDPASIVLAPRAPPQPTRTSATDDNTAAARGSTALQRRACHCISGLRSYLRRCPRSAIKPTTLFTLVTAIVMFARPHPLRPPNPAPA